VYAEVRSAPELFTGQGLSMVDVVEATIVGYEIGMKETVIEDHPIVMRSLLCGMRHNKNSQELAELVVKYRDKGVVGFDIAGPEDGFPPSDIKKILLIIFVKKMPILLSMLVKRMESPPSGKQSKSAEPNA